MKLQKLVARGAIALSASNFGGSLLSLVGLLVLTRLLVPSQFGQVALIIAVVELVFVAANWSLATALVRELPDSVAEAFNAAFALVVVAAIALVVVAAAGLVGSALAGHTVFGGLLLVIVFARVLPLVANVFMAEIDRRFAFRQLAVLQVVSSTGGWAAAIAAAFGGLGVWALAIRELSAGILIALLGIGFSRWRPHRPTWAKTKELVAFGATMSVSRAGDVLFHRFDNLVVGAFTGTGVLGLYNHAYNIAETTNRMYMPVLAYVPLPVYATLRGDRERTSAGFGLVMFLLSRTLVPVAVLMIAFPRELLTVLFGSAWVGAASMLPWLSSYALLLPVFTHMRELVLANGVVRPVITARALQLAAFLPLVTVLTWRAGGRGAAIAVCVGMALGTTAMATFARRYVDISIGSYLAPVVGGALALAAGVLIPRGGAPLGCLLEGGGVALSVYAAALAVFDRKSLPRHVRLLINALATGDGAVAQA